MLLREIFPQSIRYGRFFSESQNEGIFTEYFQVNPRRLNLEEERYLSNFLKGSISKWFIPHFLKEINDYSYEFMKTVVDAGIKIIDPSYNNLFVISAKELYKAKVSEYLIERFPGSSMNDKRGIFRLFYWVSFDKTSELYEKKLSMLLEEYFKTKNQELRKYISLNLPAEIDDYPDSLNVEAKKYLER